MLVAAVGRSVFPCQRRPFFGRRPDVVIDLNIALMFAAIPDGLFHHAALHDVVADDAGAQVADNDAKVRAAQAGAVIVHAGTERVSCDDNVDAPLHVDVRVVQRAVLAVCAAAVKDVSGYGNGIADCISGGQNGQTRPTAAVEIVAGDVEGVRIGKPEAAFAVPLYAVPRHGHRGCADVGVQTGAAVAGHPVVEDESVPSVYIDAVAVVGCDLRMANREAPDMPQMDTVAAEMADAA